MKRFLVICILITLLFTNISPSVVEASSKTDSTKEKSEKVDKNCWPKGPSGKSLSADSAIVMELSTGLILYEKNIHKEHYPASITKIMTSLLCLENSSLGETVTFSHDAIYGIERNSSHIGIDVDEQLTMEQCLYAIMLESANEASLGVAEHVAGDISSFADMMNAKAKELGCENTHFANPNGLHNDNHYTSAYDMALISKAAMENSTFRKITSTKRYTIPPTNKQSETRYLRNHQQMLNPYNYPQYEYEYCIGGKTGYTTDALATLVTFAEKDGMDLVCVVMRAASPSLNVNEYTDTINLLNFAFENYTKYTTTDTDTTENLDSSPFFTKYNYLFSKEDSPLQVSNDASVVLPITAEYKEAQKQVTYYSDIKLQDGENIIGNISYTYGGKTVGSSDIIFNKISAPKLVSTIPEKKTERENKTPNVDEHSKFPVALGITLLLLLASILIFLLMKPMKKYTNNYRNRKKTKETFDQSFTDFKL